MTQSDSTSRRPGRWTAFAVTAVAGASAITIALPPNSAVADPVPPAPTTSAPAAPTTAASEAPASTAAATPAPAADPNAPAEPAPAPAVPAEPNAVAPAPAPADPNAPAPAPADPNAPAPAPAPAPDDPARVNNAAGGFSYLVPVGWEVADASRLSYGQALLLKQTAPAINGQPASTATDTSILLGRLDLKLFAGAEADNGKAAVRLASDMGEFFMPFPGTRINQQAGPFQGTLPGAAASYDVKFSDASKPNGQIWAGVVGTAAPSTSRVPSGERWFVVYLGTAKDPIDTGLAKALAQSIKPYTPPPPPPPDPNAAPAPAPAPGNRIGVPIPVETPVPEMMPGG